MWKASKLRHVLWLPCLNLVWAIWWGGLSFYAIVVVPIGTEQIGSVGQGYITQQVTRWLNSIAIGFVLLLAIEAMRRKSRSLWIALAILAAVNIALIVDHAVLSSQMNATEKSVETGFYAKHAVYLWLTAVQWFVGLVLPWFLPHRVADSASDLSAQSMSN